MDKLKMHSADLTQAKIAKLAELFPNCVTEAQGEDGTVKRAIDFDQLRQELSYQVVDGIILISIDDAEVHNLRQQCDEVFGRDNFIACFVWEKGRKNDAKLVSIGHEYILVYARSMIRLRELGIKWREEKPGAREIWTHYVELRSKHGDDDGTIEEKLQEWYAALPKSHPSRKWARYKHVDKHGPWRDDNISWPSATLASAATP
jgi:adenine-specific DNA-methyltransferase